MRAGELVREIRRRHGLSQEQLAIRLGTKQPAISRLEKDELSPTVETLSRVLMAMGESLQLGATQVRRDYDPLHRGVNARRSPDERLRLAISWNHLAGKLAEAGRRARR